MPIAETVYYESIEKELTEICKTIRHRLRLYLEQEEDVWFELDFDTLIAEQKCKLTCSHPFLLDNNVKEITNIIIMKVLEEEFGDQTVDKILKKEETTATLSDLYNGILPSVTYHIQVK